MQVSAEIRWFWPRGRESAAIGEWLLEELRQQNSSGGEPKAESRIDCYLKCSQELGLKKRGGKDGVEIKGLVGRSELDLDVAPFVGPIEIWSKWGTEALQIDGHKTIETAKSRWLRKFDTGLVVPTEADLDGEWPKQGCNVEYTRICADGKHWESFSFEAFGALANVESSLRRTAELLSAGCPALPSSAELLSYPAWLEKVA